MRQKMSDQLVDRICYLLGIEKNEKRFQLLDCKFRALDVYKVEYPNKKEKMKLLGKRENQHQSTTGTSKTVSNVDMEII